MTTLQTATGAQRRTTSTPGLRRRRSTPHILLGAVLMVVCGLAFAVTALRVEQRTAVLAVAGSVPARHCWPMPTWRWCGSCRMPGCDWGWRGVGEVPVRRVRIVSLTIVLVVIGLAAV